MVTVSKHSGTANAKFINSYSYMVSAVNIQFQSSSVLVLQLVETIGRRLTTHKRAAMTTSKAALTFLLLQSFDGLVLVVARGQI